MLQPGFGCGNDTHANQVTTDVVGRFVPRQDSRYLHMIVIRVFLSQLLKANRNMVSANHTTVGAMCLF